MVRALSASAVPRCAFARESARLPPRVGTFVECERASSSPTAAVGAHSRPQRQTVRRRARQEALDDADPPDPAGPQAPLPRGHRRPRTGPCTRNAARRRHARRGLHQAADRHRVVVERDHSLQPVAAAARPSGQGGRAPGGRLPDGVRHDLGLGRHLDGARRDALLAGQPRDHRGLGGDGRAGRAARRHRAARRLRQEPARHAHGRRPARPRGRVRLRRVDSAGLRGRPAGDHRRRVRSRRRLCPRAHLPRRGRRDRAGHLPR